jgi:hypothetical protein
VLPGLADGNEVDRDAGGGATFDLTRELLGLALCARDVQRPALGEAQRLPGLAGETPRATVRWASLVSAGVAQTWLERPAARGEVWEASVERSSTAARRPRRTRWYAALAPKAPEPMTATSAELIKHAGARSASGSGEVYEREPL